MAATNATEDAVFEDFQKELEALDTFRDRYRGLYGVRALNPHDAGVRRVLDESPPALLEARDGRDTRVASMLDHHDPDVARLLEGLAFFSARTRRRAERAMARFEHRALEELFPFLLSPMPSMALLVAEGAARLGDAHVLPEGTEVLVHRAPAGRAGGAGLAIAKGGPNERSPEATVYRTLQRIDLLPIEIDRRRFEMRRDARGHRSLHITLRSHTNRAEDVRRVEFYVNPQGDVTSALRLHHALLRHVEGVTARFLAPNRGPLPAGPARLVRTTPVPAATGGPSLHNPIEQVRRDLHFPLGALGFAIEVPAAPSEWTELTFELQLAPTWPSGLVASATSLVLHAAPMINLKREFAEPSPYDATRSSVPVVHGDHKKGFAAREILGVYDSRPSGMSPLLPEALAQGPTYYSVDVTGLGAHRRVELDVHWPGAFASPALLVTDVDWYQPLAGADPGGPPPTATPASRHIEGIRWSVSGPVQRAAESPLYGRRDRLSRVLRWSSHRTVDLAAIVFLLELHGADGDERWRRVLQCIASASRKELPDARSASGRKAVYEVTLRGLSPTLRAAADFLLARVPTLLADWTADDPLEVRVHVDGEDATETTYTVEGAK